MSNQGPDKLPADHLGADKAPSPESLSAEARLALLEQRLSNSKQLSDELLSLDTVLQALPQQHLAQLQGDIDNLYARLLKDELTPELITDVQQLRQRCCDFLTA
jgi:hypothetical protein